MSLRDERMQILNMIQNGQISAEEGAKLLAALQAGAKESDEPAQKEPRWFRVRVTDLKTGKSKVNMNIPMTLVDVGMRMGARFIPEGKDEDYQELGAAIRRGALGKIIDVEDEEDGEHVEIYVE